MVQDISISICLFVSVDKVILMLFLHHSNSSQFWLVFCFPSNISISHASNNEYLLHYIQWLTSPFVQVSCFHHIYFTRIRFLWYLNFKRRFPFWLYSLLTPASEPFLYVATDMGTFSSSSQYVIHSPFRFPLSSYWFLCRFKNWQYEIVRPLQGEIFCFRLRQNIFMTRS